MHLCITFTASFRQTLHAIRVAQPLVHAGAWLLVPVMWVAAIVLDNVALAIAGAVPLAALLVSVGYLTFRARGGSSITVTITDTEYRIVAGADLVSIAWTDLSSVRQRGGLWVFRRSPLSAVALPAAALDAEQTEVLVRFLRSKRLLRPAIEFPASADPQ